MSYEQHIKVGNQILVRCAVITLSDTRTSETDRSGQTIVDLLSAASHRVVEVLLLKDDPQPLKDAIKTLLARADIDVIFTNGGTGISRRDQTIDAIEALIEQPLPGFGELFRFLSFEEIGSGSMLSRAVAGIANGKPIFAMPGSTAAVKLAMTRLILPELGHLVSQLHS